MKKQLIAFLSTGILLFACAQAAKDQPPTTQSGGFNVAAALIGQWSDSSSLSLSFQSGGVFTFQGGGASITGNYSLSQVQKTTATLTLQGEPSASGTLNISCNITFTSASSIQVSCPQNTNFTMNRIGTGTSGGASALMGGSCLDQLGASGPICTAIGCESSYVTCSMRVGNQTLIGRGCTSCQATSDTLTQACGLGLTYQQVSSLPVSCH